MPAAKKATAAALNQLPPAALERVAEYFGALAEPMRLRILNVLCAGEMSVGEMARQVQSSPANVSRHLAQMARHGLIVRESRGPSAYYRIADPTVHALCELVCGSIVRRYQQTLAQDSLSRLNWPAAQPASKTVRHSAPSHAISRAKRSVTR